MYLPCVPSWCRLLMYHLYVSSWCIFMLYLLDVSPWHSSADLGSFFLRTPFLCSWWTRILPSKNVAWIKHFFKVTTFPLHKYKNTPFLCRFHTHPHTFFLYLKQHFMRKSFPKQSWEKEKCACPHIWDLKFSSKNVWHITHFKGNLYDLRQVVRLTCINIINTLILSLFCLQKWILEKTEKNAADNCNVLF